MHTPLIEAEVVYGPGRYEVVKPGGFVRCAVTGKAILLEDLRYWSVERQEAYSSVPAAADAEEAARRRPSK